MASSSANVVLPAAVVYDNRAALYATARWGRITAQEDFEDTHKSVAFDEYLTSIGKS